MAIKSTPRVRVPAQAKAGEIIDIKTLISHDMESGQRKDSSGKTVPRDIIHTFQAAFNGKPFFTAEWFPSISANPFQSFFYKAKESGAFTFSWKDDQGGEQTATAKLTVA